MADIRTLLNLDGGEIESEAITAIILSAIQDSNPSVSLEKIYSALCQSRSESHLDPLSILPSLLSCRQPAAKNLISLIGECGSSKEVVIVVPEILERVNRELTQEEEDEHEPETESPSDQLISLIQLYSSAIPRLKLRKKSPSETLLPLFAQLEATVRLASSSLTRDQGREIIRSVSNLASNALSWAKGLSSEDTPVCQEIAKSLLDTAISECAHCIQSSLAQRTFETLYPRLKFRSNLSPGWEAGEKAIEDALAAYLSSGITFSGGTLPSTPSIAYLILLSHSNKLPPDTEPLITFMLPIFVSCIQTNHALDEALSLLLQCLHAAKQPLSPDIAGPLCALLPSLASNHPDSDTRHHAFRILSQILSLTPPPLRLEILRDLVADVEYPQMRIAAVGLVKEAVLSALSEPKALNLFASPLFLQVFGPILLRPDPRELFQNPELSLNDMDDSPEPARLVECLSLYYILLLRDTSNCTGIRDRDQIANIERTFLLPLRSTLLRWMDDPAVATGHMHAAIMPLVSLKTSLERVDAAIANLRPATAS